MIIAQDGAACRGRALPFIWPGCSLLRLLVGLVEVADRVRLGGTSVCILFSFKGPEVKDKSGP